MPTSYIGLGGNRGLVADTFRQALDRLDSLRGIDLVQLSPLFQTAPVGENAGAPFVNAVAELRTKLSPGNLLHALQETEDYFGRVRKVPGVPRTLDLDLLFYGSEIVRHPGLTVPHPACWYRRFVLDPLAEIAPDY